MDFARKNSMSLALRTWSGMSFDSTMCGDIPLRCSPDHLYLFDRKAPRSRSLLYDSGLTHGGSADGPKGPNFDSAVKPFVISLYLPHVSSTWIAASEGPLPGVIFRSVLPCCWVLSSFRTPWGVGFCLPSCFGFAVRGTALVLAKRHLFRSGFCARLAGSIGQFSIIPQCFLVPYEGGD